MSLRAINYLFAFVLVILSQAGFSQSFDDVELQKLLIENPSLLENFEQKKENNSTNEIDRSLTSKKQDIVTRNEALAIDPNFNMAKITREALEAKKVAPKN